jgi:hypothetical protein
VVEGGSREGAYDLKTIAEKVAQLKRYAKSLPGSVYVEDRRKPENA